MGGGVGGAGSAAARCGSAAQLTAPPTHCSSLPEQENFFFDGAQKELSSQRVVLRVRFYNVDHKALITVKVGEGL